tara:strand:- start:110 stop:586 length:477 start_codon:yes stop_codon:yes gene_type:complete
MNSGNKQYSVDDFIDAIENYVSFESVMSCSINPEAEQAINLTSAKIKQLSHDECLRHAYVLYQYCNYVQGVYNKHLIKLKWAEQQLGKMVSAQSDQFSKYMKWEQKIHAVVQNDDFAQKLWDLKVSAEGKVTWLTDKIRDMRKQADVLVEIAKKRRYK